MARTIKNGHTLSTGTGTIELDKWLRGRKIVEATEIFFTKPTTEDHKKAKSGNPTCCLFAVATKREYNVVDAFFWQTRAYIGFIDENGREYVRRYMLPKATMNAIVGFDKKDKMEPHIGYVLLPPSPTTTLAGMRENYFRREKERIARGRPRKNRIGKKNLKSVTANAIPANHDGAMRVTKGGKVIRDTTILVRNGRGFRFKRTKQDLGAIAVAK